LRTGQFDRESEQQMQQIISKEQLWEKINLLNPFLQQTVVMFIDSLLKTQTIVNKRDKSRLLNISVWSEEDIQQIEEAQNRMNAWQLPVF
jgi:hypothetical protein